MTQTNLQFSDQICQRMIANGMVNSQADFSKIWLGKSASYLSSSKARQRHVPDVLIQRLFDRLEWRVQNYQTQANLLMGIKSWRDAYEKALLLHVEVQNYLAWKAVDRDAIQFTPERLSHLEQRLKHAAPNQPPAPSAFAKLISFAKHRKAS
jgi:hypothetical protein